MAFHVPNKYRFRDPNAVYGSDDSYGNNGMFFVPMARKVGPAITLSVVAGEGLGWEHCSVSLPTRCPTWPEMCHVKALFWDDTDLVVQFHPPAAEYVNCHKFCLHLWRKLGTNDFITLPDSILVGPKDAGVR